MKKEMWSLFVLFLTDDWDLWKICQAIKFSQKTWLRSPRSSKHLAFWRASINNLRFQSRSWISVLTFWNHKCFHKTRISHDFYRKVIFVSKALVLRANSFDLHNRRSPRRMRTQVIKDFLPHVQHQLGRKNIRRPNVYIKRSRFFSLRFFSVHQEPFLFDCHYGVRR